MASPELSEHPSYYTCSDLNCPCVRAARRRTGGKYKRDVKGHIIFSDADVKSAAWTGEDYPRCMHMPCTLPTGPDMSKVLKLTGISAGAAAVICGIVLAISSLVSSSSSSSSSDSADFFEAIIPIVVEK